MTDQISPAGGATVAPAAGGRAGPIAPWPGTLLSLSIGEVFVRTAPGEPGAEHAVFVHGLGGSAVNWTDLMDLLSRPDPDRPAAVTLSGAALDLPGFGFSPVPADGNYSLEARAAVAIALIEQHVGRPVHLVGNSMGGAIATKIAARRPDLVRSLTLISPAMPDLRPRLLPMRLALVSTPGVGRFIMSKMQQLPPDRRADMTIMDLYADPGLIQPERRAEAIAEVKRRDGLGYASEALIESGRALVAEYMRVGPGSLWRDAALVVAPTLVLHGSHDRLVNPVTAARAARTFRNCRAVVLPRIGHVAMMERPDLVAAEMREFLTAARLTG